MCHAPGSGASADDCFMYPLAWVFRSSCGLTLLLICRDEMETKELIRRFQTTCNGIPEWAWPFNPPIPMIGKDYRPSQGLLIYASAENLSWLTEQDAPTRFRNRNSWNRYRVKYDTIGRSSPDFFPTLGIQPLDDGGLLAAGLFIAQKLCLNCPIQPRPFLEKNAVSNWCKFSIRSSTNRDYITDTKKLTTSLPFVISELAVLQPAAVLVPKQIWKHPILSAAMRGASPWSKFIPIPQFNSRVINCHLTSYDRQARLLQRQSAGTPLAEWMSKLRSVKLKNAWRYMAMLNELSC